MQYMVVKKRIVDPHLIVNLSVEKLSKFFKSGIQSMEKVRWASSNVEENVSTRSIKRALSVNCTSARQMNIRLEGVYAASFLENFGVFLTCSFVSI